MCAHVYARAHLRAHVHVWMNAYMLTCARLWASVCVRVHYMRACLCARMWVRVNVCRTGLCIHVCPVLQQRLDDLRWKATPSKYSRPTVDSHSTVTELGPVVQCTPVV